jgi:hypothetical protein
MGAICIDSAEFRERFWSRVQPAGDDDCWPWMRGCQTKGYGQIYLGEKAERSHRIAFYLANGHWPKVACHDCDNPICCNPKHIIDGSYKLNMQHRSERGRTNVRKGEDAHQAKLSAVQVLEIRRLHATGKYTHRALADLFNAKQPNVTMILTRRSWKHI